MIRKFRLWLKDVCRIQLKEKKGSAPYKIFINIINDFFKNY